MEEMEEDEDVVLEGSAFHVMLQDSGFTDFQPTLVNRCQPCESSRRSSKLMERMRNFFARAVTLNIFDDANISYLSGKQISTILRAETLLDDHTEFLENLLEKNSQSSRNKLAEWSTLIASSVILGASYLTHKRNKILLVLIASSVAAFATRRKYDEFRAVGSLKNLVCLQNELHRLYKKGLRIVSKSYGVRTNSKQARSAFSNLNTDRLKLIQPLTETVLKSFSSVARIYYKTSRMIAKILPRNDFDDFLTRFEDQAFEVDGTITYDEFKKLYYVYMTAQSEAMQLLAVAYDANTWIGRGRIPHSRLTRVIFHLCRLVKVNKTQLQRILDDYESCKTRPVPRTFRGPRSSKWRDLYLNLDLLSCKVETVYAAIGAILSDIESHGDSASTADDNFVAELTPRVNEIRKQIETARNFAEFADLLTAMLGRRVAGDEEDESHVRGVRAPSPPEIAIVRDSEPLIIDEVFEEYITEEYLKPLRDEGDEDAARMSSSAKLDKLLAKNFMSELKEALVDKCKSMSEREARALLRSRRRRSDDDDAAREKPVVVASSVPPAPPLLPVLTTRAASSVPPAPPLLPVLTTRAANSVPPAPPLLPVLPVRAAKPRFVVARRENREFRSPVPLPRTNASPKIPAEALRDSLVSATQDLPVNPLCTPPPPPPPPPPPLPMDSSREDARFSIDLSTIGARKIPAFVALEEEFVGSGENSEEERANDDNEDDVDSTGTD